MLSKLSLCPKIEVAQHRVPNFSPLYPIGTSISFLKAPRPLRPLLELGGLLAPTSVFEGSGAFRTQRHCL